MPKGAVDVYTPKIRRASTPASWFCFQVKVVPENVAGCSSSHCETKSKFGKSASFSTGSYMMRMRSSDGAAIVVDELLLYGVFRSSVALAIPMVYVVPETLAANGVKL